MHNKNIFKKRLKPADTFGFTLIELLVVIAIIGVLSTTIIASLQTARMRSRDARRFADLRQLRIALENYNDANLHYPIWSAAWAESYPAGNASWAALETMLAPYIAKMPVDPLNISADPWVTGGRSYAYYSSNGKDYDLVTQLENISDNNIYPAKCWKFHYYEYALGLPPTSWAGGSCGGAGYSPYIYADH